MSVLAHHDYPPTSRLAERLQPRELPLRRMLITAAGCAVMAISGTGLASYLDTSSAAAQAATTDAAPVN